MSRSFFTLLVAVAVAPCLKARDLRVGVDPDVPTIHQAIKISLPGDVIHLQPKVYHDCAGFYGKAGEPGKPVTLDGHGAVLDGSDPIVEADWKQVEPGLYANDHLLPRLDDAILGRWFFLLNGSMSHMGRTSKGKQAPFKEPVQLQPGEWTFVKDLSRTEPGSKAVHGTFFVKLADGKSLADANIRVPVRSAGVQFSGKNAHLVIRNITATHVYNDGFNIHGDCWDVKFENIRAIECGDDGISAHETAQYEVDGFVSIGNSTGICDTGASQTSYNRVFIARCIGHDLFFLDTGRYRLTNVLVLSSAQSSLTITGRESGGCRMVMENVWIQRLSEPRIGHVLLLAELDAKNVTLDGMELKVTGKAAFVNTVINGKPAPGCEKATGAPFSELDKLRLE